MGKAQLTPEGWRCEKKSEHLYRPKWVDFQAPAIHLLTLVTTKRRRLFGEIQTNGTMRLSPLGQQIAEEIKNIPSYKVAEANGMAFLHLYTTKYGEVCRVYRILRSEWENLIKIK